MKLDISHSNNQPLYKQIYDQIRLAILNGELEQGEILPSIRHLAKELDLSVITVKSAYNELERNNYITTRQGKGCFVSHIDLEKEFMNSKLSTEKKLKSLISESRLLGIKNEDLKQMFENLLYKTSDKQINKETQVAS